MSAPKLLTMLQQLIATPSVSSVSPQFDHSNIAVIELLANWLQPLGFQVEIIPIASQPGKANLIATMGSGSGGLVLSGHTDTVPFDDHLWSSDPLQLTERDNRLYGIGSADMKSFFGLIIEAVTCMRLQPKNLRAPLLIVATADEESSMDGAKALTSSQLLHPRYAVIGEPTSLRPINAHKGIIMEAIHLQGRSGHSSDPSLGNSALEAMQLVMAEILMWRTELQQTFRDDRFHVPVPTLNFGHIHGGDNPNRICGDCTLHIDLRPMPGMAISELRTTLSQRIAHALRDNPTIRFQVTPLFDGIDAMYTPETSALIQYAEKLTGYRSEAVAFGTEGPFFQQLGAQSMILGPGNIDQAHQPDEYIDMAQLQPSVAILQQLIQRFCLSE